ESTAEDLGDSGRDNFYGWGLIDAKAALQSVLAYDLIPLDGWEADLRYTNEDYILDSSGSSLFLQLNGMGVDSRVTIRHLNVPKLNLSEYVHVDVACSGTANARILLRFFLDDGSIFDVVYWKGCRYSECYGV
ncbi:MAG: hypothetical protein QMD23_01220, partial [Candidatus Bathyarchaeia archaeon]|nr:hypothetical protein [Candidatus Bathyarchaeia archaeon]